MFSDNIENWTSQDGGLYCRFQFVDFVQAFAFMTKVAFAAERLGHHPTWTNTYNVVDIWLITHDKDNQVTEEDIALALAINEVFEC